MVGGYLFIFFARVLDVSLGSTRILFLVRGQRLLAAVTGFFEVSVFILALAKVITGLNEPLNLVVYALGFAAGTYAGGFIEEKLALGHVTVMAVPRVEEAVGVLVDGLRERGFGVTVLEGSGRSGPRKILFVTVRRRQLRSVLRHIEEQQPEGFVTVMETRRAVGPMLEYRKGK